MEGAVVLNRPPYFEGGVYPGRPLNMAARRSLRLGPVFTGGGGAGFRGDGRWFGRGSGGGGGRLPGSGLGDGNGSRGFGGDIEVVEAGGQPVGDVLGSGDGGEVGEHLADGGLELGKGREVFAFEGVAQGLEEVGKLARGRKLECVAYGVGIELVEQGLAGGGDEFVVGFPVAELGVG